AFDKLGGGHRAQLLDALPRAMQAADVAQQDRRHGQRSLFEVMSEQEAAPASEGLKDLPPWPPSEQLKYEKEALDFYVSSHPLAEFAEDLRRFAPTTVALLKDCQPGQEIFMGGMLTQVRFQNTKKARNGNTRYARCKLEDFTGAAECVMWPDDFVRYKDEFQEDRSCFVKGTVEETREDPGLILTRILSIEQAQRELTRGLVLSLSLGSHQPQHIDAIRRVLEQARGSCPVYLSVRDGAGKRAILKLNEEFNINPSRLKASELEMIWGRGSVKSPGPVTGNGRNGR